MPFDEICLIDQSSEFEYLSVTKVTRNFRIKGIAGRDAAEVALFLSPLCPLIDPTYPRLVRKPVTVTQEHVSVQDQWLATATWEDFIPKDIDRETISGSVSLVTQNVKNTYDHVGSYGPGAKDPMDAGGLINVTEDGANGVDVEFPVLNFSISRLYNKGTFTLSFLAGASQFTAKPNNAPWRGFGIGTVRLLGIEGSDDTGEDFDEITFSFQASPTVTNVVIESPLGSITVPEKLGWQYLHIQSVEYHNEDTGITSFVPHTAHVDELTEGVDLGLLI